MAEDPHASAVDALRLAAALRTPLPPRTPRPVAAREAAPSARCTAFRLVSPSPSSCLSACVASPRLAGCAAPPRPVVLRRLGRSRLRPSPLAAPARGASRPRSPPPPLPPAAVGAAAAGWLRPRDWAPGTMCRELFSWAGSFSKNLTVSPCFTVRPQHFPRDASIGLPAHGASHTSSEGATSDPPPQLSSLHSLSTTLPQMLGGAIRVRYQ